jgi:DNA-binding XRE family transcriptional regulator
LQEITTRLRATTPLYELTAALTVPWLLETFEPAGGRGGAGDTTAETIAANLVALMRHLFDEPGILEYDPWPGLIEWIWSHQTAWAGAAIRRHLGTESIRELSAEDYHRHLAHYLQRVEPPTLRERSEQLLSTYAQELAKVVVETLDLGQITPERLALLLARKPPTGPAELLPSAGPAPLASDALAALLTEGHLPVMSSAHYQAVREALYLNTFERVEDTPWPTARLTLGPSHGQAQLRPPGADGQAALPSDQVEAWAALMWQQRDKLSDLDADALDALSALWLSQARSSQDRAVADVDGLLTMRGIQPRARSNGRRVGFRVKQRDEMQRALAHIQNLWINIADVDDPDGVRRTLQSRAFVITDRYGVTDKTGTMVDMERFVFQPGRVFAHFLMGPGQQTALLSAKALKYDPYRQTWEKRLSRFLSWQWRVGGDGPQSQPYLTGVLLSACGAAMNARFPQRTRDHLEHALDTLQEDGVIAAWQYRDWDERAAQQHGWAEIWRGTTLLIAPPPAVIAYYQSALPSPAEPPSALPAPRPDLPESPVELGALIKARRRAIGVSQIAAATELGVSQSYISKLERGKLPEVQPSREFRSRLARWLSEF